MSDRLSALWLGRRPYAEVLELQRRLFEARKHGEVDDVVLFLDHEPVITTGRGTHLSNLLASKDELESAGVSLAPADRGGDVTLHAPGQLVCYPIVSLPEGRRDVRKYVRGLQRVMAEVVAPHGVGSGAFEPHVGLWADAARPERWDGPESATAPVKIGAIGVRISRWTTMHGFALNLDNDLGLYRFIVPCGIRDFGVASVATLSGRAPAVRQAAEAAFVALGAELGLELGSFSDRSNDALVGPTHEKPRDFLARGSETATIA